MKVKVVTFLVLLFLVFSSVNAQQESSKIVGTWRLTSFNYQDAGWTNFPDSIFRIKLITPTHFTWVQYMAGDKLVKRTAGGRYVLNGDNYVETINFAEMSMYGYVNKEQPFKIKIEGNKLTISGFLSSNFKIEEVWTKLE